MRAPADRVAMLASPPFLAALILLVVNDFALKSLFHNAVTGKLSDFAGLFALTLFAATLWPRGRWLAAAAIAAAFAFWKTAYAEPLIETLNAISPFAIGRTVDLTDLMALPMVPLAVWAAARLEPWPLPRTLQVALAVVAPVAFTATSRVYTVARTTMEVPASVVVDERELEALFDGVARSHGLRCTVCDAIGEGRVYGAFPGGLTANFDAQQRTVYFAASDPSRRGERELAELTEDIRSVLSERFPGIAVVESTRRPDRPLQITRLTIRIGGEDSPPVEVVETARRRLSAIVEDVVRAHDLRTGERAYFAGRRRGEIPGQREFTLVPQFTGNETVGVEIMRYTSSYEEQHRAVTRALIERFNEAFGPENVTEQ